MPFSWCLVTFYAPAISAIRLFCDRDSTSFFMQVKLVKNHSLSKWWQHYMREWGQRITVSHWDHKSVPLFRNYSLKKSFLSAFLSKRIWTFSQMVFTAIVFYRLDGGGWDRCNIHGCNSISSRYLPLMTWEAFITFPFCYSTSFSLIIAGLLPLFIFLTWLI